MSTKANLPEAIRTGDLPDVLGAVRALLTWDAESAETVHFAVLAWCERALAVPPESDDESPAALYDFLGRLRGAHGEEALDAARPGTAAAWRAFEELLSERQAQMARNDQHLILKRAHTLPVMARVFSADGPVPVDRLADEIGADRRRILIAVSLLASRGMVLRLRDESGRIVKVARGRVAWHELAAKGRR